MKSYRAATPEEYRLMSRFTELCRQFDDPGTADILSRPLAYWALPSDRRLPHALLDRPVGDLIRESFTELISTPGIGPKKMNSLLLLLGRAAHDTSGNGSDSPNGTSASALRRPAAKTFDTERVSESHWESWRQTVRRHHLSGERLGHLAESLQQLPTVIWRTPLERYLPLSLREIRKLKTHGDKRMKGILEVFYSIHQVLGDADTHPRLAMRLVPAFVTSIEDWLEQLEERPEPPAASEIRDQLTLPLLNQLRTDGGETVYEVARGRLGLDGPQESVREQAERLGVTRARVYQLLDTSHEIMHVRWPDATRRLERLRQILDGVPANDARRPLFERIHGLVVAAKDRPAPAPVETVGTAAEAVACF